MHALLLLFVTLSLCLSVTSQTVRHIFSTRSPHEKPLCNPIFLVLGSLGLLLHLRRAGAGRAGVPFCRETRGQAKKKEGKRRPSLAGFSTKGIQLCTRRMQLQLQLFGGAPWKRPKAQNGNRTRMGGAYECEEARRTMQGGQVRLRVLVE